MKDEKTDELVVMAEERFHEFTQKNPANLSEQQMQGVKQLFYSIIEVIKKPALISYSPEEKKEMDSMAQAFVDNLNRNVVADDEIKSIVN